MAFLPSPHFANYQQLILKAIVVIHIYNIEKEERYGEEKLMFRMWAMTGCVFEQQKREIL